METASARDPIQYFFAVIFLSFGEKPVYIRDYKSIYKLAFLQNIRLLYTPPDCMLEIETEELPP